MSRYSKTHLHNSPDKMEATAAMMKETMTPGPAISLATRPDTTYMPVPTQLPTPREMRSRVVRTLASLEPWAVVVPVPSNIDSTGLVRRTRVRRAWPAAPHGTRRGSRREKKLLMAGAGLHGGGSQMVWAAPVQGCGCISLLHWWPVCKREEHSFQLKQQRKRDVLHMEEPKGAPELVSG